MSDTHKRKISIFDQEIYRVSTPAKHTTPLLSNSADINEIALSPHGDMLAWLASSTYTPPIHRLFKKFSKRLAARTAPHPVLSIYVSKLDGSQMRLLGMESSPPNSPDEAIRNVRWRPDGKSLSYRWHKGVYLVPVE